MQEQDGWQIEDEGDLKFETIGAHTHCAGKLGLLTSQLPAECSEEEKKTNAKYARMLGKANKVPSPW